MMHLKLWVDDVRPAPEGYIWLKKTNEALRYITLNSSNVELIDLDHDAGDFVTEGGDYINILNELERLSNQDSITGSWWKSRLQKHIAFRIHSANPVGVERMRAILRKNDWKEIY